ncbi:MAG: hypothetical protein GF334_01330 [Candidatus Altiarchaeales archaeon]|nr:hypothetical protein [Candidatus Altiarchaeales archaeon]
MQKNDIVSVKDELCLAGGLVISPKAKGRVVDIYPSCVAVDFKTAPGVYQRVRFSHDSGPGVGCNVSMLHIQTER